MTRRSVRVTLVCLGVLLTVALSYRVLVDERVLASERQQLSSIDTSIADVLRALSDVQGVMHAYVAPGQRSAVWEARSAALFDKLRQQLIALDAQADSSGGSSLNDSLDNLDQLTAADKRVQRYLDYSQPLLAGDVIFTEIRDLVNATAQQVSSVRDVLRHEADGRIQKVRREQAILVLSGTLSWLGLGLLLALLPTTARSETVLTPASAPAPSEAFDLSLAAREPVARVPEPLPPVVAETPTPAKGPEITGWKTVSSICNELASVKDLSSLAPSLSRACEALGAKDAIVWVASANGDTLAPQASHGFDPRLLARIGSIARDSANLTAAAFRDGQPHLSAATTTAPGAFAVALRGPSGPVGVFSAELEPQRDPAEAADLAMIFAAQVAPLVLQAQIAPADLPQRRQA